MEIITFESETYKSLVSILDKMNSSLALIITANPAFDEILSQDKVCLILDVTPKTLQAYRVKYKIPHSKIGNKFFYKKSALINFLFQLDAKKKSASKKVNYVKY